MMTKRFACILRCGIFFSVAVAAAASAGSAKAETYSQIPPGFSAGSVELYFGNPAGQSQFDAMPTTSGDVSNFATIYDNFSFGSNLNVTNFSWIGLYQDDPTDLTSTGADSFTVSIYSDTFNATEGLFMPDSLLTSTTFTPLAANETSIDDTIYSYSADISPFAVTAGEQYWFSVVANMNADADTPPVNEWGVAFSASGDGESVQDFQTGTGLAGIERFYDPIDYAFSVTAVPEPATGLALLMFGGGAAVYRRMRRRSEEAVAEAAV